ncbi:Isoleucyl-tRNA synthetase [secondary endosymbiont of Heteropsylla cubana]|uniref:Isoleucine--tRNA ligase n=1 Tax=secondary endosymbiont of Heteropsylla cubana TaxID=134287 RepID=J3VUF0_9ENTR|nr:isoleucine--tRNA ligase [secondary endosymbiont of Heteropsylla cubana]AFP85771.1 Isoleucyl-tRNA synthetase [secondary endosymbiont of Heteropsylla cubana]
MTNYKDTLNLPNTGFPMRGNLPKNECVILNHWYQKDLYGIIRQAKKGKKTFILHDGPPYANGRIHIGHAVNKVLKDIIIKSKGLMGYDSPYVPGWDCHGLPIELKVEQLIGKPVDKIGETEFRKACRVYAAKQIEQQKEDFIRLGVLGDWNHPYLTMNFITEANIIRAFSKIVSNGHVYKGIKPVNCCIDCRSSLAEAEIEYHDHISTSIYVAFLANDTRELALKFTSVKFPRQIFLLIWTTTPWTLPANRAISVHPDAEYQLIEFKGNGYILAADLVATTMARADITTWRLLGRITGKTLEFLRFRHPFMNLEVPVILSRNITLSVGTGAVHIAPDHGQEDYLLAKKYGLKMANLVGLDGCYLKGTLPALDGVQVFKANDVIIDLLRDRQSLLHTETLSHSYPHCWRHKTPIIFCSTPQWFLSMEQRELRKKSMAEIKKVQWIPEWGQACIEKMITNRPDWCISRQRAWGVPITLFLHNETELLHPETIELMEIVAKKVEKKGVQAWWDLDPETILGNDAAHYHKVMDTLDVWFDSGSTHASVIATRAESKGHTPDLYLEGSDQHRGWFMSSLMIATAMGSKAPYNQVLTHSFTVDGQGRKMSKSIGNVVTPNQIIEKFGADVLRLWVASNDYTSEITVSDEILKRSADIYRRIRNTARFLLGNLDGFDPEHDIVTSEKMVLLDRWAVEHTYATQVEIISYYNNYDFHNIISRIMRFCSVQMGSFYLEIIKDRQYTSKANGLARRSCQTALYHIIEALVRWIAPIMSFTADELWKFIPGKRSQYVFTEEWYNGLFGLDNRQALKDDDWKTLLQIRNETNKIIEQARIEKCLGGSLEASVTLYAEPALASLLKKLGDELSFALITSDAVVENYLNASNDAVQCDGLQGLKISLVKAKGKKCPRCWRYDTNIGKHYEYQEICSRCIMNIYGVGEERKFV